MLRAIRGSSTIDTFHIIIRCRSTNLREDKKVYAVLFDGTLDAVPHFSDEELLKGKARDGCSLL